jgi:hypothetical protein
MFCGIASKIAILSKKGGTADVTPDSVDWPNASSSVPEVESSTETITGINTTIVLQINISLSAPCFFGSPVFQYSKNGSSFLNIASGNTINIQNNDTLSFYFNNCRPNQAATFTVINNSDGNTVLDTFTLNTDSLFSG